MKKSLLILGLWAALLLAPLATAAEEPLLDNHLDLKTDRLNKEQTGDKPVQQTTVDDRLFNSEEIEKLKKARTKQESLQKQALGQLFTDKSLTAKEVDTEGLFTSAANEELVAVAQNEAAAITETQSTSGLMSLLVVAAGLTIVSIGFYQWKKRGQMNGRTY